MFTGAHKSFCTYSTSPLSFPVTVPHRAFVPHRDFSQEARVHQVQKLLAQHGRRKNILTSWTLFFLSRIFGLYPKDSSSAKCKNSAGYNPRTLKRLTNLCVPRPGMTSGLLYINHFTWYSVKFKTLGESKWCTSRYKPLTISHLQGTIKEKVSFLLLKKV